jgi:hypothetical protein
MQPFNIQTWRLQIIWFIAGSPWLALQQVTKAHDPNFCFQSCSRSSSTCSSWFLLLFCETCGRRYKIKLPWAHLHNNCQTLVGSHPEYCSWVCPKTSNWMKSKSLYELWWWHHIKTSSSVWTQSERIPITRNIKEQTENIMRRHGSLREKKKFHPLKSTTSHIEASIFQKEKNI